MKHKPNIHFGFKEVLVTSQYHSHLLQYQIIKH